MKAERERERKKARKGHCTLQANPPSFCPERRKESQLTLLTYFTYFPPFLETAFMCTFIRPYAYVCDVCMSLVLYVEHIAIYSRVVECVSECGEKEAAGNRGLIRKERKKVRVALLFFLSFFLSFPRPRPRRVLLAALPGLWKREKGEGKKREQQAAVKTYERAYIHYGLSNLMPTDRPSVYIGTYSYTTSPLLRTRIHSQLQRILKPGNVLFARVIPWILLGFSQVNPYNEIPVYTCMCVCLFV